MPNEMQAFLRDHRSSIIDRWVRKVRESLPSEAGLTEEQLRDSLPLFVDEIIDGLGSRSGKLVEQKRSALARVHGGQRQHLRLDIAELVREYGLFYECVIELHAEHRQRPNVAGLSELAKCLFTGAAEAVDEFAQRADETRRKSELRHFAFIAHELRNPLGSARLAWERVRKGAATEERSATVLSRSLSRVAQLIDETLASVRLAELGRSPVAQLEDVSVPWVLAEAEADAKSDAELKKVQLVVEAETAGRVRSDPRLLLSALTNVVRNAIKFTHSGGTVVLRTRAQDDHLLFEVEDQCGGLPAERAERLFEVFAQSHENRTGFGLGLSIAKQAIEAQGGTISVRNVPTSGCIFVWELSRAS